MNNLHSKMPSILLGLIAIGTGAGYLLKALGIIENFTVFFDGWWTVFLFFPGLLLLLQRGVANKIFGGILIVVGAMYLLQRQGVITASVSELILPLLMVVVGVIFIAGAFMGQRKRAAGVCDPTYTEDGSLPVYEVSFGEINPDYNGRPFGGCKVEVSFGKATLDLRKAVIESDCQVQVQANFGAAEILLPTDCKLDLHSEANFGAVQNDFTASEEKTATKAEASVEITPVGVQSDFVSSTEASAHTVHLTAQTNFGTVIIH